MPLTPEDVRNKLFTTVRLREGYEQAEVDEFLDEVEAELSRLLKENDDLRTKLIAASRGEDVSAPEPVAVAAAEPEAESVREPEPVAAAPAPPPVAAVTPVVPQIVINRPEDVTPAAARLLEMAQRTADEVIAEAKDEADRTVGEAQESATRLTSDAKTKADELDRETRARSAALDNELGEQRQRMLGKLEEERARLDAEVEGLKAFEREYRGRLRSFLDGQLRQLQERGGDDTPLAPNRDPSSGYAMSGGRGSGQLFGAAPSVTAFGGEPGALGRLLEAEEQRADSANNSNG